MELKDLEIRLAIMEHSLTRMEKTLLDIHVGQQVARALASQHAPDYSAPAFTPEEDPWADPALEAPAKIVSPLSGFGTLNKTKHQPAEDKKGLELSPSERESINDEIWEDSLSEDNS